VIDDFVAEYRAGRTPNPCVRCNERIKFGPLLSFVDAVGATALATGHYARLLADSQSGGKDGGVALRRARDADKDQSYFLFGVRPEITLAQESWRNSGDCADPEPPKRQKLLVRARTLVHEAAMNVVPAPRVSNSPEGAALMDVYFDPVVLKLVSILKRALPDYSEEDIFWGYHFVTGALMNTLARTGRIDRLSNGVCHSDDFPEVKKRIAKFMAAGFRALKKK